MMMKWIQDKEKGIAKQVCEIQTGEKVYKEHLRLNGSW